MSEFIRILESAWKVAWGNFAIGFGLVVGVAIALAFSLLLRFVTGPLVESIYELFESRIYDQKQVFSGEYSVFISDIHVDTWILKGNNNHESEFRRFMYDIEISNVKAVYFGGDFADIPVHPISVDQPPLLKVGTAIAKVKSTLDGQNPLVQHIRAFIEGSGKQVVGITGNHDLGVNGVRAIQGNQALWNPALLINGHVYIEHGHRFDPLNWLYLRYSLMDLTRRGYDAGPPPVPPPSERVVRQAAEKTPAAGLIKIPVQQGWPGNAGEKDSLGKLLVRLRWRGQARKALWRLRKEYEKEHKIDTFLCGHTHLPDRYRFLDGTLYINLGDWAGDRNHRSYTLMDSSGYVHGPYSWDQNSTLP